MRRNKKLAMTEQKCRPTLLISCWAPIAQLLLTDDFLIIDVHLLTARPQQIGIPSIVMVVVHRNNKIEVGLVFPLTAQVSERRKNCFFHFNSADLSVLIPQLKFST